MRTILAYWVGRGATVHASEACVPAQGRQVELRGPHLPADQFGQTAPWRACGTCGAPLIRALADDPSLDRAEQAVTVLWDEVTLWGDPAGARSWQRASRAASADLLREVADDLGWDVLRDTVDDETGCGALVLTGPVNPGVAEALATHAFELPLPPAATDLHRTDPRHFADVADVYARLAGPGETLPPRSEPARRAQWAQQWWDTACAVAAPASV